MYLFDEEKTHAILCVQDKRFQSFTTQCLTHRCSSKIFIDVHTSLV